MSLGSSLAHLGPIIRNRDLRLLLGAGLISQTGDWILATGISFQIYALTGSTVAAAIALLVTQAPQVLFGSVAGVLVDRWNRRRVMIITNVLLAIVLAPLALVSDASQIWIVYVVVGLSSCLTPFFVAAEVALLPSVVEPEDLITANAVNAQLRNVSRLIGAALGGVIIATGGLLWLAVVDVATFVVGAALIAMIKFRQRETARTSLHLARDWLEGIGFIRRSRVLIVILIFFVVSGLGEAVMGTLFAPFVQDVIGGDAQAFGAILSAQAIGGIVGGFVITAVGHRIPPRLMFGVGAVIFGIGDLALFLYPLITQQVWLALVIIALVGVPGAAVWAGMLTLFQTNTNDGIRGRVWGALSTVQNLAMLGCTYLAGVIARELGIVPVISFQGAVYVVAGVMVLVVLTSAVVGRTLDQGDEEAEAVASLDNPILTTMLPSMSLASNVRTNTISDPLALRALAHPVRQELQGLVAREGTLTAADAARQLGISHALASHHLRQLAKYGFIEPADSPDSRSHPWRVTATSYELKAVEPDARASVDVLERYNAERATQELTQWQQQRRANEPDWSDVNGVSQSLLYLDREEYDDLMKKWFDLVYPLAMQRPVGHAEARPAEAVPVEFTMIAVPLERTERGG